MNAIVFFFSILSQFSFVFFIISFVCGMLSTHWFQQGHVNRARWAAFAAFASSSLLSVLYIAMCFVSPGPLTVIFTGIWIWIAWRNYQYLQQIGMPE